MEKDKLKLELLEKIIACEDAALLKKVEEILDDASEVNEGGEEYVTEADPIPASHYKNLEEDFKKFEKGEIKGTSWDTFREEIKSKNGF